MAQTPSTEIPTTRLRLRLTPAEPDERTMPPLTARQTEVLRLAGRGLGNRQIGSHLGISEGTVRKHMEHIHERLDVRSRTAAIAAVFALDLASG